MTDEELRIAEEEMVQRRIAMPLQREMALRDYFAAAALQGLLIAHPEGGKEPYMAFALFSYKLADDMMEERLKEREK